MAASVASTRRSDFYVQRLVLAPAGYSGWHTHPGILIGTVVSGSIDFYDANCNKTSFTAGQVFMENNQVHAIGNTGGVESELSIAYLVKHNQPRRIEADAPFARPRREFHNADRRTRTEEGRIHAEKT